MLSPIIPQQIHEKYQANADDVIQPSSLRDYRWPESDPSELPQLVRAKSINDIELVIQAATNVVLDAQSFEKNTRNLSIADKVHFILTHQKFQVNPTAEVRREDLWRDRIARFVDKRQPIRLVYPLMCKVGSWAKQMVNIGPTAGEDATLFFFRHLNNLVKAIYEPGLIFTIVSDATLYNTAFCNPQVEVASYVDGVRSSAEMYASDIVEFHDYAELLAEFGEEYLAHYNYFQKLIGSSPSVAFDDVRLDTLFESVKASINVRKRGMPYRDMREVFSKDANPENPFWSDIDMRTRFALAELVSIRKACSLLNCFERRWPGHVRASCHKDKKWGRWIIGLRPYPEYFGSSKLLPYHGVPVVTLNSQGHPKMDITPEVMVRGCLDLIRVEDMNGDVYLYDGTGKAAEKANMNGLQRPNLIH